MPIPTNRPPVPALVAIRSVDAPRFPFERPMPLVPSRTANLPGAPSMTAFRTVPLGPGPTGHAMRGSRGARAQQVEHAETDAATFALVGFLALASCASVLAALALL